ncbi:MAG: NrfD/PsrC family molybdoenzyme membrane anchor subunit [Chloroflexota bacterium]
MIQTMRTNISREPVFFSWLGVLLVVLLIGLYSALNVLFRGLSLTNLSDSVPWGLWITVDLSAIALGAGAFSLSALVYLLRIERLRPVARIAVFTGLIGYTGAMLALLMDIGRPERFWHPIIYWNIHSVLWEITMCVILYATVLLFELAPIILDSKVARRVFPAGPRIGHALHRFAPAAAVLGLILSMLHQSSLGATYGVLVARPIWFKPSLPVMFILSAVGAGTTAILAVIVFYENLTRKRQIPRETRNALAVVASSTLAFYLYLNLWDYLATNYYSHLPARVDSIALLNRVTPYGTSYWLVELLFGTLVPLLILAIPALRKRDSLALLAGVLVIIGLVVNRWNVTLSGLIVPLDWSPGVAEVFAVNAYRPSWTEWGVAALVVGYVLTAYTLALRYLPFFEDETYTGS